MVTLKADIAQHNRHVSKVPKAGFDLRDDRAKHSRDEYTSASP